MLVEVCMLFRIEVQKLMIKKMWTCGIFLNR
uniref:Uncharacterized protein n=1 Tax=Populus trichocarpa TaxID=3694 RepID=A0A3N7ERS5_POPTR